MNKRYHSILASDLDGTLLFGKDQLSKENYDAITALDKMGVCFAPCSGRALTEMPKCILDHPSIRYYISADGSSIYDKQTDTHTECALDQATSCRVLDILNEYRQLSTVRSHGISYVDGTKSDYESLLRYRMTKNYAEFIRYYCCAIVNFDCVVRHLGSIQMICAFFEDDREMAECKDRMLSLGVALTSSEKNNVEIHHANAGKGNGVLMLADLLGVPHERTFSVGDSENDMDMIKKAGVSLAMENASDRLKAMADHTICHYKDHSAKYILEHFFSK